MGGGIVAAWGRNHRREAGGGASLGTGALYSNQTKPKKVTNQATKETRRTVDRNGPCMSRGSIILWIRKEEPSGGGVDGVLF